MLIRGTFLMIIGQASFMLSAFAINFGLARLLGPIHYGTFGLVMSILVAIERLVVTGIPEMMQKYGGERPKSMYVLKQKMFPRQLFYTVIIFGIFWLVTPLISKFFADKALTLYLHIASFDIIFYGLYKFYLGMQNGLHRFNNHALMAVTYSASKVCAVFGLVLTGLSLTGALIGNALGSVGGLILGIIITRLPKAEGTLNHIPYFEFIIPNILYFLGLFLFFCIDLWFVKYYSGKLEVGYYVSASALSKVPYFTSIALSAALLPSVSFATKKQDRQRVNSLVQQSLRYIFMGLVIVNILFITMPSSLIYIVFGAEYSGAAEVLPILGIGLSFLTFFAVMNTILMARNRIKTIFIITFIVIVIDVVCNYILVPRYHLIGAAVSTSIAAVIGTLLSGINIFWDIKIILPFLSFLRISGTGAVVFILSIFIPEQGIWIIIKIVTLPAFYFLLLWIIGELTEIDLRRLKEIIPMEKT